MKEIRLYIFTNASVRGRDQCKMAWLMQYVKDGQVAAAKDDHGLIEGNQKKLTLEGIIDAVTRINDGNSVPLTIVCHCPGVIQAVNQSLYTKWSANGWKSSEGKEVECVEEWQRIVELFKDKVRDVEARPPHSNEDHIMQGLGAEQFEGHLNIA